MDVLNPPLVPAQAGIQGQQNTSAATVALDSRSRGNERSKGRSP